MFTVKSYRRSGCHEDTKPRSLGLSSCFRDSAAIEPGTNLAGTVVVTAFRIAFAAWALLTASLFAGHEATGLISA